MYYTTISLQRLAGITIATVLLALGHSLHAQKTVPPLDPETAGRTYVLAYPDTVSNIIDSRFPNNKVKEGFSLFLYSATPNNNVRITSPSGVNIVTLDAGTFKEFPVKGFTAAVTISNRAQSNVVRVEADAPIIVYCYFAVKQSCEMWTPIPVEMWGTQYNVAAAPGGTVNDIGIAGETALPLYAKAAPAEATIIAAYDSTRITINAHERLLNNAPPLDVVLNKNEVYQIQSWCDTVTGATKQVDIAGISIRSSRPVGVLSGNTRTLIAQGDPGLANNAYKNMLMEWLPPVEARGTEFVFLPTWDGMQADQAHQGLRVSEFVQIVGNANAETKGTYASSSFSGTRPIAVPIDTMQRIEFTTGTAGYIKTSSPAEVMLLSNSITKFNGASPCFQGLNCLSFSAWAPFMTEITPREQWTSFAPFVAPSPSSNLISYINVVTDTNSVANIALEDGSRFPFTMRIQGTDLIWGSMKVQAGTHYLTASSGARFGGHVYGIFTGSEDYRPGRQRKDDDGPTLTGDAEPLHPCEYEEYNALSYGYPLAPRRSAIHQSNELNIDTATGCSLFSISIHSYGASPIGIKSVVLEDGTSVNARLVAVTPSAMKDIPGSANAELAVLPVDEAKDTKGAVIITDQQGTARRIPFDFYRQTGLTYDKPSLNFDVAGVGMPRQLQLTITNNSSRNIPIRDIHTSGLPDMFHVISTQPSLRPVPVLKPKEQMIVILGVTASRDPGIYADTLHVGCEPAGIPMRVELGAQHILVSDPVFGNQDNILDGKKRVDAIFGICNDGRVPLTLQPRDSGEVIVWNNPNFTIAPLALQSLKEDTLQPGECRSIKVTFTGSQPGAYGVVARVWASTRNGRDSSIWLVSVSDAAGAPAEMIAGYSFDEAAPNPFKSRTELRFRLGAAGATAVEIYNDLGTKVATLADGWLERGPHTIVWDATGLPAGIYRCRVRSGSWNGDRAIILQR